MCRDHVVRQDSLKERAPHSIFSLQATIFTYFLRSVVGSKLRGSFLPGVVFAKGCEFLLVSLGEGFGVRFRWVVGGGLPVGNEGTEEAGGEWGGDRQKRTGKSMRTRLSKLPLSKLLERHVWRTKLPPKNF